MPKTSLNKTINLLNPINEPEDIWTKIYNWVTRVGKYLLVLVCGVVLAVFFARFFLDKQNNDLTTEINDKIDNLLSIDEKRLEEVRFRGYQNLLFDVSKLSKSQVINSLKVSTALDGIPKEFILKSISFDGDRVNLSLSSNKLESIGRYSTDLSSDPQYDDVKVSVTKTSSNESLVDFTISFMLVKQNINK
jgi:hypothetical protein